VVLIAAGWGDIVGPEVAKNSHPSQMTSGALLVTVRTSAWSQQLSFLTEQILAGIRTRLPDCGIERLRFRVGRLPLPGTRPGKKAPLQPSAAPDSRAPAADAREAMARFRADVTDAQRAKRTAGWNECAGCTVFIAPGLGPFCVSCTIARDDDRQRFVSRLLFEAPWLGYAGTAELIEDLSQHEYAVVRRRVLARWWETLSRVRAVRKCSADGHERLVASSFVILKSGLSPERIGPATVRNVLGDELHQLIYGTEQLSETNVE
ncbi:MAG: DUF721 domain-containing protein, partial [Candidatus Aquilonibacter sp.]